MNAENENSRHRMDEPCDANLEKEALLRKIKLLERDNRMLTIMNANAERLRASYEVEKRLQYLYSDLLLKSCPNMLFLFNQDLRLVSCSVACGPLLSVHEKEDLINLAFKDVFDKTLDYNWLEKVWRQNCESLQNRQHFAYDDTIVHNGNQVLHMQVVISPIIDDSNDCRGTIMSINDITELTRTKEKAEEAARSKSSFLANMSHEIRTPMNAVKGLSELLALTELNDLQRNYVHNIISSSNSLLGIINDVLDFSKIDANKIEFVEGPYNLSELITGVCNVVSFRAEDKELAMLIEASPNLPTRLLGDDMRLKQVLTNLLSNAVKYTVEGHVLLRLYMEKRDGRNFLVFEVEDTGVGIRDEEQKTLFDAFSRADLRLNRGVTGTGLGLAIAKQLSVAMGGDISLTSIYGKGSIFTFWVPQEIVDDTPLAVVADRDTKHTLLLGDDLQTRHIQNLLQKLGVACTAVCCERELKCDMDFSMFTHTIFHEMVPDDKLQLLRQSMPHSHFAAIKDMRHAMTLSEHLDTILYTPLFITELASYLNKSGHETEKHAIINFDEEDITVQNTLVLVVDDNEINRVVSGEMLRSFNAEVVCAESGEDALVFCQSTKYDIIFMDHMMPGLDGVETTIRLRSERGPNWKTPIVALTANVVNDMESYYLRCGMDDFIGKPVELIELARVLIKWLPKEKVVGEMSASHPHPGADAAPQSVSPQDLLAAMDKFGFYSSDVMREINGDFDVYVDRMAVTSEKLGGLVSQLKKEVAEEQWDSFAEHCMELRESLYGIGARDCAARARKLALAARKRNISYVHEDFFSLMGNMYMLDKKLVVLVPIARGGDLQQLPLNVPQYLHGCLDKMGRALRNNNAVDALMQLENAAAFSLDMDLDMALKQIKLDIEKGNFVMALKHHTDIFRQYTARYPANATAETVWQ